MRVLVADKDPSILSLVNARLTARGYEVIEASDKEELLRLLDREEINLILLATDLDCLAGLHLVDKIREKPHLMTVPVLMMSTENHLAELLAGQERGFDDFLLKPFNAYVLQLRVAINLRKIKAHIEANALTHLPGNHAIERVVMKKIEGGEVFSVIYIDINNFKSFNDVYGFDKGDAVIQHTARILTTTGGKCELASPCFVGHIGGDDFVVILDPDDEEIFARAFIDEFDRVVAGYYNDVDQKRGYIRVTNRKGKRETFPIMSVCVAACNNLHRKYRNMGEIVQDIMEVKSFLKSQPGSHYLRNRRSEPVRQVEEAVELLAAETKAKKDNNYIDPLGKILLNAGLITEDQLSIALRKHFETGKRLGQVLIHMDAVKSEDVGLMLEKKLKIPYVNLKNFLPIRDVFRLFTWEFIQMRRVLPLEIVGDEVKLGMCDPYDIRTLDDIERITGLKPIPCLTLEDEFERFLERWESEFSHEEKIV